MAIFGRNWKDDSDGDGDGGGLFSRWKDIEYGVWADEPSFKKSRSIEETLDQIDISEIEKYLRKKKLQNLNENGRKN